MFWGLIMEPNKRYTQTVEKPFHISQAAMDTSTGDNEICQVMVVVDGKNFLICTLQKNKVIQVPLDLYFKTGNVISFLTNGKSNVHLTGYLDPEFDDDDDEEEENYEEAPELVPAKNKRKLEATVESSAKKLKQETKKLMKKQEEEKESDDDDDDDDDDNDDQEEDDDEDDSSEGEDDLQKLLDGEASSDENDDSFRPNSTAADSEDDSDEAEEETTLNTTSEPDTSKEEPKKLSKSQKRRLKKQQMKEKEGQPQINGVEKKSKKDKDQSKPKEKEGKKENKEVSEKPAGAEKREKKTLSGGVFIEDLKVGSGPVAKAGKEIEVYYEGRLKQNNKMFDSCNKGPGFRFRVGHKEVISGWDVGIAGMKVGGKRKIICPPAMAYGNKGSPPVIPPNSTLVFEVELKKVK